MPNFDAIRPVQHAGHNSIARPPKKHRRFWKWLILLAVIITAGIWGTHLLAKTNQIFTSGKGNIFTRVSSLIISPDKPLIGETEGSINVLLMGVGGSGHDGAYLTDTMIVANINTQTHEVILTSIPRDFALTLPKVGYNKINAAYAYAYRDNPNTAGDAAIAAAEQVTGFTIPYYAVIDFKGFVKAIDHVGGVDVIVDNTFTDSTFPNDYPYDTRGYLAPVTFTKGPAHMDGHRALIFARSRHSNNPLEGSDFSRSERQKKILSAFKEKIFSLKLTGLATINNLLSDFTDNFRTNLEPYELKRLMDISKNLSSDNIYSYSLDPDGVLICSALIDPRTGEHIVKPAVEPVDSNAPSTPEMYVVRPCEGKTLTQIQEHLLNVPLLAKLKKEGATIEIQNSTGKTGLADKTFGKLANLGVTLKFTSFKGKMPYDQTIFYDNSNGHKPTTLKYLQDNYTFVTSDVGYPTSGADFVIIMGKDSL